MRTSGLRSAKGGSAAAIVNNVPFVHEANGDFTIDVILALVRRIVTADKGTREGRWNGRAEYIGVGLTGRTPGLLGFGRAARAVAQRTTGFGCEVLAYSRNPDREVAERLGVELVEFQDLVRRSGLLSIHVTLTDQTRGIMGREQIHAMKPGACLINTSRGAVLDEEDLVDALRSGHLSAPAVDDMLLYFNGKRPGHVVNPDVLAHQRFHHLR